MSNDRRAAVRIVLKALSAFIVLNLAFALLVPVPALGRVSVYNTLVPGRERLPYGDVPAKAYNLSLYDLNAMFSSHVVSHPKAPGEYRVVLIGDSSTWGWFLRPGDTLAGLINAQRLRTKDGRQVRVYNLGYPIMSLTKDVLMLSRALQYQPDLIVWPMTLESFPAAKQLSHPIVQNNAAEVRALITRYQLRIDPNDPAFFSPTFLDRTLIGQRRALADWLRLQAYGPLWGATGVDQYYPDTYEPAARDLEADPTFAGLHPPALAKDSLALDVLASGIKMARDRRVPLLVINEPILVSQGKNSDVRYDFFYPRWAYDQYRTLLRDHVPTGVAGVQYLDVWDAVPEREFTNSAVHLSPAGARIFADKVSPAIQAIIGS